MEHGQRGCGSCGRPFAVADRFCPQCGRPILPEDRERAAGWETCAIRLRRVSAPLIGAWRWRFVAEAGWPGPPAIVAESPVFAARTTVTKRTPTRLAYQAPPPGEAARVARAALVQRLAAAGWEGTMAWPGASERFAQRFRRRGQGATDAEQDPRP